MDNLNRGYEECTVIKIDGKNGMVRVKKFADSLNSSKDPNARLNEALASMIYNQQAGTFVSNPGQFSARGIVPDNLSMQYELQCANSRTNIILATTGLLLLGFQWSSPTQHPTSIMYVYLLQNKPLIQAPVPFSSAT